MRRHEDELIAAWTAFIAEANVLAATDPESITPELLERLEALSDPFIHLVGHRDSMGHRMLALDDPAARAGLIRGRARRLLRDQIVAALHAQRLHVGMPSGEPPTRSLRRSRRIGRELLAAVERAHQAVVVPELAIAAGTGHELWETNCDTLIELSSDIPRGQYLALKVAGDSMEPMLHSGDVVLVKLGRDPVVGRVVVARHPDHGYVVKEIGRVTVDAIELRSLNPAFGPVMVPPAPEAVLGTVLLRWCPHGSATGRSPRSTKQTVT